MGTFAGFRYVHRLSTQKREALVYHWFDTREQN
jgi:hypothetical protein